MLTRTEMATLLASVKAVMQANLRPELQTDEARSLATAAVTVLNVVLRDLGAADAEADTRIDTWLELARQLDPAAASAGDGAGDAHGRLRACVARFQSQLESAVGYERLLDGLRSGDAAFAGWFRAAVAANADLTHACLPVARPEAALATATGKPIDATQTLRTTLEAWLHRRYPELLDPAIVAFRMRPGGYAKQTALFTLAPNGVLPEHLVLRLDMAVGITGTTVKDEFPIIWQAFELGLPVPEPIALEDDPSVMGGCFMLMTEIRDATVSGPHFPEERGELRVGREYGRDIARVAARLHAGTRVPWSEAVPDYALRVQELHATWRNLTPAPHTIGAEMGYAWLETHPLGTERPWCLVHGDFGMHNILVRDGRLAGVVDWELAHIGDPAEDLALFRMMVLPGIIEWDEFVEEYIAAGGDPAACDERAVGYFCVWMYLYHVQLSSDLRAKYLAGDRSDIMAATLVSHYLMLLTQYLSRALKLAVDAAA